VRRFSGCCLRLLSITVPLFSSRALEVLTALINLAHSLLESAGLDRRQIECRFTGLRPGEKISEQMTFDEESLAMSSVSGLQVVLRSPRPSDQLLNDAIEEIDAALEHRDLSRLMQAILSVVPEYSPSVSLQRQLTEEMRGKTTA
jgi:FlaA1/EpsC-like NDP-sugar epimerase